MTPTPCKYCGAAASFREDSGMYAVECQNQSCPVFVGCIADSLEQAVERWNRCDPILTAAKALADAVVQESRADSAYSEMGCPRPSDEYDQLRQAELERCRAFDAYRKLVEVKDAR